MRTSNDLAVLHFTKFVTDAQITVETTKCLHSFLANMVCLLEQVAQSSISISRVSQQTNIFCASVILRSQNCTLNQVLLLLAFVLFLNKGEGRRLVFVTKISASLTTFFESTDL